MRNESELPVDEDRLFDNIEQVEKSLFELDSAAGFVDPTDIQATKRPSHGQHSSDLPATWDRSPETGEISAQDFDDLISARTAENPLTDHTVEQTWNEDNHLSSMDQLASPKVTSELRISKQRMHPPSVANPSHRGAAIEHGRQRKERSILDEQQRANEHFKAAALSRIQSLEIELENKNNLIQALTERLEQAAEQLDRLHRTGADRKVVSSSFGASVDRHATLTADMQRFLEQWDAMQPAVLLGQLDSRLADIRDYLSDQFEQLKSQNAFYMGSTSQLSSLNAAVDQTLDSLLANEQSAHHESSSEGNSVLWESLKSQMLSVDEPTDAFEEGTGGSGVESLVETDFTEPEVPLPFNIEDCQQQEFETAINQRDAYISWLIRRLRAREISGGPPNWAALEHAPAELVDELRSLQVRLEEHLRLAEVELSLERARCARDLAKVRQQQEVLRDRPNSAQKDDPTPAVHNTKSAERRWRRFLGTPPRD
ncbi:hypothetical protein [Planctopirus hydrillae]|uniref:Uncharacterized protein n=1 Tax=Planctopirus hydrillae TaxID=1841610 RepID=A0A1C3E7C4_9PLAN|nr:hypothetical protein [Planctopirus hydrillae]ODA29142.1 hypothetical protein A6X21_10050 [Planctopirus hydrillae]